MIAKIREIKQFNSKEELINQLRQDITQSDNIIKKR
ncbi:MAG: riboflavin kinase [Planctomycetaceae bacterium]|nr:riboflavin kinase [Planctomycetaceae bacterium]